MMDSGNFWTAVGSVAAIVVIPAAYLGWLASRRANRIEQQRDELAAKPKRADLEASFQSDPSGSYLIVTNLGEGRATDIEIEFDSKAWTEHQLYAGGKPIASLSGGKQVSRAIESLRVLSVSLKEVSLRWQNEDGSTGEWSDDVDL